MIQRQIPHKPGTFTRCRGCGHEPKHYEIRGYSTRDVGSERDPDEVGHRLECYPCRASTTTRASLDAAIAAWNDVYGAAPRAVVVHSTFPTNVRAIK